MPVEMLQPKSESHLLFDDEAVSGAETTDSQTFLIGGCDTLALYVKVSNTSGAMDITFDLMYSPDEVVFLKERTILDADHIAGEDHEAFLEIANPPSWAHAGQIRMIANSGNGVQTVDVHVVVNWKPSA